MRLVAHRGFAAVNPENTVAAVGAAAPRTDAVEVDVRCCADGTPVVVHDERIDRVTGGTGRVDEHSLADLRALSVEGSGEPVPSLAAVLDALPADTGLYLELKEPGVAADALDVATDHLAPARGDAGGAAGLVVQSFRPAALAAAREAAPSVPRSLLVAEPPGEAVSRARELGCTRLGVHHDHCTPAAVAAAHDAGLRVDAWTVDDAATAIRLVESGVDGVISDVPGVLATDGSETGGFK